MKPLVLVFALIGGFFITGWLAGYANTFFHEWVTARLSSKNFFYRFEDAIMTPLVEEPLKLAAFIFAVYVVPGLVSVYNIIVIRSFIQGLPESLTEAAMVDGAGHFRCYWQIVLPCCKPVLATVALWCAVGAWNQWFDTFLYCSSKENLTTLQYEMMKLLSSATQSGRDLSSVYGNGQQVANTITPTSIRAAVTIVASAPILVVYPFLQKYFVKGVTLGATKG